MENILKNIVIGLIVLLIGAITFFFWKMTPKTESFSGFKPPPKDKKVTATPKSLQFKTGFETHKKSEKKESSGSAVRSIDYFKINK